MPIIWPHWETIPVRPIDYDEKLTPNAWDKILIADNDDLNKMKYWKWENFKWEDAPLTQIQYSSDNTNWSSTPTIWDHYIRFSTDNGATWWAWVDVSWPAWAWSWDMLKSTYDPTNKNADAFSMDNMVETATKKILTAAERTNLSNQSWSNTGDETATTIKTKLGITTLSGSNTGDQTSIVWITWTIAQFNTALTDADFATGGGTATGTNTGDNATNSQYSGLATSKQDTLVSGTNIKTINGTSILWSGDITITGGSSFNPILNQVFS